MGQHGEKGDMGSRAGGGIHEKKTIFAARFLESGTYEEIFGGGAAVDFQLLLLRYQHVLTYPYQQWVVHSPLSPWRLERALPQR